ncbi:MAG: DUF5787 family protein [Halodesulfurarchaeum sp.]
MSFPPTSHEFGFELAVCGWAEHEWPPSGSRHPILVARQLGWQRRRWDTIVVEVDPAAFDTRLSFGHRAIERDLRHVLLHAPREWTYYRDALPEPSYPWRYVREAIHTAAARDLVRKRKRKGRIEIERKRAYDPWVKRIVAIENKPDLDASAARRLAGQLERDVAAALAEEVWLATSATGERVEPVLLENLPSEVGILGVGPEGVSVLWHPRSLDPNGAGIDVLERASGPLDAAHVEVLDPAEKREKRLGIAERALENGWRSYVEGMRSDCTHFVLDRGRYGYRPWCGAFDRGQSPRECGATCPAFEPEPPADRSGGWPIEGGPGRTVEEVLADRRRRRRQSVSSSSISERGTESR